MRRGSFEEVGADGRDPEHEFGCNATSVCPRLVENRTVEPDIKTRLGGKIIGDAVGVAIGGTYDSGMRLCLVVEEYRGKRVALHDVRCNAISRRSRLGAL